MVDEKYYTVSNVGSPKLPNFRREEKQAPESAKWVHVKCNNVPVSGEVAERLIRQSYIGTDKGEGMLDVEYSTDDGGWISIVVESDEFVDKGARVLLETLERVEVEVDVKVDSEDKAEDTGTEDDSQPRYIH